MTITRIAATAMLAGLAIGTASTAWADPPTMSGHYIETRSDGVTNDWIATPCGDGCASITSKQGSLEAHLVNGQWVADTTANDANCRDGSNVSGAITSHYTWDPNTLAGNIHNTMNVPACGNPAGQSWDVGIQLKQAA
jgi:hypothetical protein